MAAVLCSVRDRPMIIAKSGVSLKLADLMHNNRASPSYVSYHQVTPDHSLRYTPRFSSKDIIQHGQAHRHFSEERMKVVKKIVYEIIMRLIGYQDTGTKVGNHLAKGTERPRSAITPSPPAS